ncbi:MAG TPA: 3'-5' exonuclease [Bacteroidetes bacterium]|nr:3'-5' exonuclease [Bacteroidota bacterium]
MYLFFDTETTGLPKNWKAPVTDVNNWPRLVQLAWILTDAEGNELDCANEIIFPDGFIIPPASAKVHGITNAMAEKKGRPIKAVLERFVEQVEEAQFLIGHNISFDESIMGAELIRAGLKSSLEQRKKICTKLVSTDFCQLPGDYGYKWPTLEELHQKLFDEPVEGAHNAMNDVEATLRCFFELKKMDVV